MLFRSLRPIRPDDAQSLRDFHARLSPETVYFRFFAPRPELSDAQVEHLTTVDYRDRVALVAMARGDIIGVGRFESIDDTSAEVAFVIEDAHQGRGLGSLLLEHLAAIGRETGKRRFVAEVLPQNGRMLSTFTEAGYKVDRAYDEGVVSLGFDLTMTADMLKVMDAREHRGEARSLEKVMRPASVAVVGASREPGSIGHELLRHLVSGGFNGRIHAVNREGEIGRAHV